MWRSSPKGASLNLLPWRKDTQLFPQSLWKEEYSIIHIPKVHLKHFCNVPSEYVLTVFFHAFAQEQCMDMHGCERRNGMETWCFDYDRITVREMIEKSQSLNSEPQWRWTRFIDIKIIVITTFVEWDFLLLMIDNRFIDFYFIFSNIHKYPCTLQWHSHLINYYSIRSNFKERDSERERERERERRLLGLYLHTQRRKAWHRALWRESEVKVYDARFQLVCKSVNHVDHTQ